MTGQWDTSVEWTGRPPFSVPSLPSALFAISHPVVVLRAPLLLMPSPPSPSHALECWWRRKEWNAQWGAIQT
ncbi:hypothetical protein E4U19_007926 [Claviceps sp. Clav32 group G5]|nr:hypothetical protein E4U40_007498 [Claviceps sp. LM458 group G5]KAG6038880.1 hypothetical protein E4U19_007926 [Claviceps sp. Clav32 group G5]KAG6049860.1 hypothetical protein E4U39_005334 [Claviceps sp. Clav50 group G5]